jgi:hypothetical protein
VRAERDEAGAGRRQCQTCSCNSWELYGFLGVCRLGTEGPKAFIFLWLLCFRGLYIFSPKQSCARGWEMGAGRGGQTK